MVRIKLGGSLTSYIVIGVVLAVLVGGAAYFVQAQGTQARENKANAIIAQQAKLAASEQAAANKANSTNTTAVSTPTSSSTTHSATNTTAVTTVATTGELPHTGISFSAEEYVGLGLLVMVAVGYATSRRQLLKSL
jgi:type II secretory pathway pseudopilin PulG